jgi:phytanoyl-CoA hydroxylase
VEQCSEMQVLHASTVGSEKLPPLIDASDRSRYARDGFVVVKDILDQEQTEACRAACDYLDEQARNFEFSTGDFNIETELGGYHDINGNVVGYKGILRAVLNVQNYPTYFAALREDLDMDGRIAWPLLDACPVFMTSILFCKPARIGSRQPWHQDVIYQDSGFRDINPVSGTLWLAIDEATIENGCLEFIRGSHRFGLVRHEGSNAPDKARQPEIDIAAVFPGVTPVSVPLAPGSGVFFDGLAAHGSASNRSAKRRRAITFGFRCPSPMASS